MFGPWAGQTVRGQAQLSVKTRKQRGSIEGVDQNAHLARGRRPPTKKEQNVFCTSRPSDCSIKEKKHAGVGPRTPPRMNNGG